MDKKSNKKPSAVKSIKKPTLPTNQVTIPVVPIREGVLFPQTESVLTFGRKISLNAIKYSTRTKKLVILLTQKKADINDPDPKDLYQIGTLAVVERTVKSEGTISALVRGISRVKVMQYTKRVPFLEARAIRLVETNLYSKETKALANSLQKTFRKTVQMGKPVEFLNFMKLLTGVEAGELADQVASTLNLETKDKQKVLEMTNIKQRLEAVIKYLIQETKVLEIEKDVVHKTQKQFDKHMRESVLRERMRTIRKELGEIDDEEELSEEYEVKLKKLKASKEVKKHIKKEIKRLNQMSPNNPESGYIRSWLDIVFELPWNKYVKIDIDIKKSEKVLDLHHYGLKKVKERVLEHIAVLQLKQNNKLKKDQQHPTILCFVGPPGVGKTSIGKSIAEALGKKFTKISLGGIRDEAEIRGHRRTYVGSMPGRIINGMKQAGTMDPVFMLDEIDKIGNDFRGDPSSALLEVLDPEQNNNFEDHYLDMPFDLSKVLFITTANTLDTIPPALLDRLEIIRYSGYTPEEKLNIAKKHLLEKVIESNGLKKTNLIINDKILEKVISGYTREAGVRSLERQLHALSRKTAKDLVSNPKKKKVTLNQKSLKKLLGPRKFDDSLAERKSQVGVTTGLAWTSVGGDILFIEAALTPGKGKVQLTGQLGDVMKESAQAALTYVKANAKKLKIDPEKLAKSNVHIHVPEGAVPKDGPSAGVTMITTMVSAFTNRAVKQSIAMTGEINLRGKVMRIGGLKEKSIAAQRAGIKTVFIPKENKRDLVEIPDSVKKSLEFIPVDHISKILKKALEEN